MSGRGGSEDDLLNKTLKIHPQQSQILSVRPQILWKRRRVGDDTHADGLAVEGARLLLVQQRPGLVTFTGRMRHASRPARPRSKRGISKLSTLLGSQAGSASAAQGLDRSLTGPPRADQKRVGK